MFIAMGASAQLRWGPTAGMTRSSLHFKQDLVTIDPQMGFSAGVQEELMFPGIGMGISFGLNYEMLGAKIALGERKIWAVQGYEDPRSYLHYLTIPFHLRYKCVTLGGFEDKLAPLVYGGPTMEIMLGHSSIKAFDYSGGGVGLTVGGGVEIMKRWQVTASYTWGMTYALKASLLSNYSAKNRYWDIRLTYFL